MSGTMIRANNALHLIEGIAIHAGLAYKSSKKVWGDLFEIKKSHKNRELTVQNMGLGLSVKKGEGQGVTFDSGRELWSTTHIIETIALGVTITEEMIEDNLYEDVVERSGRDLGRSSVETKNIKASNIYNNGFDSTVTYGDGVQLLSTAHPLGGGGTFSNTLATPADMSEAAIEDLLTLIWQNSNDRGLRTNIEPKMMVVGTANSYAAWKNTESPLNPNSSGNDINAVAAKGLIPGGVLVNRYLTDDDAWFITTDCPDGLIMFDRVPFSINKDAEFTSGNMLIKARERYVFSVHDGRGLFGTPGA